jgi:L-ascorbate metabolism protein UlaG (beta-lactamase superfamily)
MIKCVFRCLLLFIISGTCALTQEAAASNSSAMYMANEGLMVVDGETKVLFDPLFKSTFGQYQPLPKSMEEALFAGEAPFDGIDAIFISHFHGDHFSPQDILSLLKAQTGILLYAPAQAVAGLRTVATPEDDLVFRRVTPVELAYKDAPVTMKTEGLLIEAVRIPHSGWPNSRLDVENISWRITLNDSATVLHMGDADPNDVHFERDADYWDKRHTHMAFPPYWFFSSTYGNGVLRNRIKPGHSVGIHVPVSIPAESARRPLELQGYDLFTRPGEQREIPYPGHSHQD